MSITLGSKVKDTITGFEGAAVARIEYLNGCVRYEVQPQKLHEGKPIESHFIDEGQLVVTQPVKRSTPDVRPGGPRPKPPAFRTPSR